MDLFHLQFEWTEEDEINETDVDAFIQYLNDRNATWSCLMMMNKQHKQLVIEILIGLVKILNGIKII